MKDFDVIEIGHAWDLGGTNEVASMLGLQPHEASRLVSNLRRKHPDIFCMRCPGRLSRRKLIRLAIEEIKHIEDPAASLAIFYLTKAMPPPRTNGKRTDVKP